jgi:hypothetical protein
VYSICSVSIIFFNPSRSFDVEVAILKLKEYKYIGIDKIQTEFISAAGKSLHFMPKNFSLSFGVSKISRFVEVVCYCNICKQGVLGINHNSYFLVTLTSLVLAAVVVLMPCEQDKRL